MFQVLMEKIKFVRRKASETLQNDWLVFFWEWNKLSLHRREDDAPSYWRHVLYHNSKNDLLKSKNRNSWTMVLLVIKLRASRFLCKIKTSRDLLDMNQIIFLYREIAKITITTKREPIEEVIYERNHNSNLQEAILKYINVIQSTYYS